MKDTMVVFNWCGAQQAIVLTKVKRVTKDKVTVDVYFNNGEYLTYRFEDEYIAGNVFDGILNARSSNNEVYKLCP